MKKIILSLAVCATLVMSSCSITMPVAVSSNPIGAKMGESSAPTYFYILSFGGDASIMTAAKKGGITRVATVDMKMTNVLGIFQSYKTIVTGE